MSDEGQKVVEDEGYIPQESTGAFSGTNPSGTVSVNGSSSVTPLMEKLKEAYEAVNTNATIEINQTDSSTGMSTALEGVCDIGMASRALKDEELSGGLTATCIATGRHRRDREQGEFGGWPDQRPSEGHLYR